MKQTYLLFILIFLWSPIVSADTPIPSFGERLLTGQPFTPGSYLALGLEVGYRDSFVLGVELSAIKVPRHMNRAVWAGVFFSANNRFSDNKITFNAGPEIGIGIFGMDGGVSFREGGFGANFRGRLTLGLAAFYGRYIRIAARNEFELGLHFKIPIVFARTRPSKSKTKFFSIGEY